MAQRRLLPLSTPLVAVLSLTSLMACDQQVITLCMRDGDCNIFGPEAKCEANNFCTFSDATCDTGRRWHDGAGDLANDCYDPSQVAGGSDDGTAPTTGVPPMTTATTDPTTGAPPMETATGMEGTGNGGTGTTMDTMTTMPPGDAGGDTMSNGDTSGAEAGDTGSGSGSCQDVYGGVTGFELCDESTAGQCTFSAVLDGGTCDTLCGGLGQTCISGDFNAEGAGCVVSEEGGSCQDEVGDHICTCSL